ncbi:hypothetical protein FA13DRAFT_18344 [Coprinellus micaceus]|uniref:Uncharacterized protein n=1 Tax=Coprinellus micaceus TaxID=71717 RepID=A0A4Y7TZV1_COPMI|nr:hypothetical protein FA13DRAFT_18344 [Coprinellus micaceus]
MPPYPPRVPEVDAMDRTHPRLASNTTTSDGSYFSTLVKAFTIMCNTPLIEPETQRQPKVVKMKTLHSRESSLSSIGNGSSSNDSSSMVRCPDIGGRPSNMKYPSSIRSRLLGASDPLAMALETLCECCFHAKLTPSLGHNQPTYLPATSHTPPHQALVATFVARPTKMLYFQSVLVVYWTWVVCWTLDHSVRTYTSIVIVGHLLGDIIPRHRPRFIFPLPGADDHLGAHGLLGASQLR